MLLRAYKEPRLVDHFTTTPTADQKLVLVTAGACHIEGRRQGTWRAAAYRPGHVGLVAPGMASSLRWHGSDHHHTLQLHVPGTMIETVAGELFAQSGLRPRLLHDLSLIDPVVATTMLGLERAARAGAPDMYGETAAYFLVAHLLFRSARPKLRPSRAPAAEAARRVEDYMQAHLSRPISLDELAGLVGLNRFQLLRLTRRAWGETPQRRLTRMRMELSQRLLLSDRLTITEIALECGYANPTHFATAFRRFTGVTPSGFRRQS